MSMNFEEQQGQTWEKEAAEVQGMDMELNCAMPDGTVIPIKVSQGVDVNWVAYKVANEININSEQV